MSRVRALDSNGDWVYGTGRNAYLSGNKAIAQQIKSRLLSVVGNCFFDLAAGIDWFNLLGSKSVLALRLSISSTILNTDGVIGIKQLNVALNPRTRALLTQYEVQTVNSQLTGDFEFIQNI